jgi:hypothetical protein
MTELTPQRVLVDLLDSDDFPVPIPDPKAAAEIVVQRLIDAGFEVRPAERCPAMKRAGADLTGSVTGSSGSPRAREG